MNRLVAIDMPGDAKFVEAIRRIWDAGDAFAPIDQRLPATARIALLDGIAAEAIIDGNGIETPFRQHISVPTDETPNDVEPNLMS